MTAMASVGTDAKTLYPQQSEGIISSALDESDADLFLSTFEAMIDPHYLPYTEHLQAILYLVIHPPENNEAALEILYHLLSIHTPSELCQGLPAYTPPSRSRLVEEPDWLAWEARSDLARRVKKAYRQCTEDGIWGLLWEPKSKSKGKQGANSRPRTAMSSPDPLALDNGDDDLHEDEDEEEARRVVSPRGWVLLEWLVAMWAQDQGKPKSPVPSKTFVAQLPQPYASDLLLSDAAVPLAIIRQACADQQGVTLSQSYRRRQTAAQLLNLLVSTTLTPKPPFDPASLRSSLVTLMRSLSPQAIITLFAQAGVPDNVRVNVFTHVIEDLAGVRSKKAAQRRRGGNADFADTGGPAWPYPTVHYVLTELAAFTVAQADASAPRQSQQGNLSSEKIRTLQTSVVSSLIACAERSPCAELPSVSAKDLERLQSALSTLLQV